jgi:hypothetical protein
MGRVGFDPRCFPPPDDRSPAACFLLPFFVASQAAFRVGPAIVLFVESLAVHLKEQDSSIGGIDIDSRAVCIAIGHLCGVTFCKNKSNNWSKVLITSGNHDAWVIPTSSRMLFSQIRAKIQGHRCILEGPNPGLIIGDSGDFIPFVLEEQTQFCLLPMYPPATSSARHADLFSSSMHLINMDLSKLKANLATLRQKLDSLKAYSGNQADKNETCKLIASV